MTPKEFLDLFKPPSLPCFERRCFYHFTDTRNLPSIGQHGLLSLSEIKRKKIPDIVFGGNAESHEKDIRRGLDKYVHLCFKKEHPMEYRVTHEGGRIEKSKFIEVAPDILHTKGIHFTDRVANSDDSELLTLEQACKVMDFEVIYKYFDWKDPKINKRLQKAKKYELLIPCSIPKKFLLNI